VPALGPTLAGILMAAVLAASTIRPEPPDGWLGVTLENVVTDQGQATRLASILPDSPAAEIGLATGDLVRGAGGRRMGASRDVARTVRRHVPGTVLPLIVERAGVTRTMMAPLAARPPDLYRRLEVERDPWQEPDRILDLLAIEAGSRVADLGAGGGYFTERLAARVGATGCVVAVEVDEEALTQLRARFALTRFPQVTIRRGTRSDPGLEAGSLDAVLMVDTFHELTDPAATLAAVRRALHPGGRLAVVDRPATEVRADAHAIPAARVVEQAEAAGFRARGRQDLARQFALVFE
jgi:predicted methyltransferase